MKVNERSESLRRMAARSAIIPCMIGAYDSGNLASMGAENE